MGQRGTLPNWGSGTEIAGRYRLEQMLGRGGMGEVWRAEHLALHSPVAIKLIDPRAAGEEAVVRRFMQEARAAASLQSPHVVRTTDFGVFEDTPYIVMELLNGESLAQRLARQHRLTPAETARVIRHVARAVGKAHEAGFVHRDLKPDNIFVVSNDDEELLKVLDFGIAKAIAGSFGEGAAKTRTGALLGTPYYMSPEQAQGDRSIDSRSDLWSMGVIAYECLTGVRPFESEGLGSLVMQICAGPIPVPSKVAAVPPGFDEWFARAVCRDPAGRFQTARELATSLRHVLVPESSAPAHSELGLPMQSISAVLPLPTDSTSRHSAAAQPSASWNSQPELGQTTGGAAAGVITIPMQKKGVGWLVAVGVVAVLGLAVAFLVVLMLAKRGGSEPSAGASAPLATSAPAVEASAPAPPPSPEAPASAEPDAGEAPPAKPFVQRSQPAKPTATSTAPLPKEPEKAPPASSKNRLGF